MKKNADKTKSSPFPYSCIPENTHRLIKVKKEKITKSWLISKDILQTLILLSNNYTVLLLPEENIKVMGK